MGHEYSMRSLVDSLFIILIATNYDKVVFVMQKVLNLKKYALLTFYLQFCPYHKPRLQQSVH